MASISCLNPRAEIARSAAALEMNISGAKGLQEVMKTNLGPKGTLKLLVSGSGDLKLTKDGNVLLHEMQIRHPTASMIAKACTAQNDTTGDGTTSTVLLIGELLKQAETYVSDGVHPRWIVEGFDIAYKKSLEYLDSFAKKMPTINRNFLIDVARTSLQTKLDQKLADHITECVVDAVLAIRKSEDETEPDLHMIEIMKMEHESGADTKLIRGLVLDHGGRHPDMQKSVKNAYILACNVGMEFEKTEVNSGLFYKSAAERERLLQAEREHITQRVLKVIELKKKVCADDPSKHFVVINQNVGIFLRVLVSIRPCKFEGIDPPSLDLFAKAGIIALRRAKRRNMERLQLACGGEAVNSVEDLTSDVLGWAGSVYEHVLGEDKFTFIENCKEPKSVTLLIKGPNKHTIEQIKDAIYDGIRAVSNLLKDRAMVPGAGAFELAAHCMLMKSVDEVKGRAKLGVKAFADALLIIPKTLAVNAGFDAQEVVVKLIEARKETIENQAVGLDLRSGEPFCPLGICDNVIVKKSSLSAAHDIASNLLQVDEVMRAGMTSTKAPKIGE